MPKRLPIGISDYKKIIEDEYYYADKTMLVREIIQSGGEVALITRPRRFGKTLNLSMLQYFFEKPLDGQDTSNLFSNTAIWQDEKCRALQGQFPVISLTFKDVKEPNWQRAYAKIITLIAMEFLRLKPLIIAHKELLDPFQFDLFQQLATKKATQTDVEFSLKFLTEMLEKITGKRTIVLLDEYDTPIQAAYLHGYYQEMVGFVRNLFTSALKDNKFLERSVMTGILRTAKEGIFSGLNNLKVCTFLNKKFSQYFGLIQTEVNDLLKAYRLEEHEDAFKLWYNGYFCGNARVYNPWSVLNCVEEEGIFELYWVNTSDNAIIKKVLINSQEKIKEDLELILNDIPVVKEIDDAFIYPGIEKNEKAVWSLLFFSGYLTYSHLNLTKKGEKFCTLCIPNNEIRILYEKLITSIIQESFTTATIEKMLTALLTGDIHNFSYILQEFVLNSMSCYDFDENEPEKSYHLFMLGLLVILNDRYFITSNREAGYGRYDIMLTPRNITHAGPSAELPASAQGYGEHGRTGVVIEFKKINHKDEKKSPKPELFEKTCQDALEQIKEKKYVHELQAKGVTNIIIYGVAFFKKQLLVKTETIN